LVDPGYFTVELMPLGVDLSFFIFPFFKLINGIYSVLSGFGSFY
jgi:hypothetical protein